MPLITEVRKQRKFAEKLHEELMKLPEEDVRNMIINDVVENALLGLGSSYSRNMDKHRWAAILKVWNELPVTPSLKDIEEKIIKEMY